MWGYRQMGKQISGDLDGWGNRQEDIKENREIDRQEYRQKSMYIYVSYIYQG